MIKGIGNTPVAKITYEYKGKINEIYAKLEYYNLTGSIKDRVAYYIIKNAKKEGKLKPNMRNSRSDKWKYRNINSSNWKNAKTSSIYIYARLGK